MNDRVARLLEGFPVVLRIPVAWGDMDAFRHVNNTVFFRYFESSRIEMMVRIGLRASEGSEGVGPILHSTSARFRRQLAYPDAVWSGVRVSRVDEDRMEMEHRVVSEAQEAVVAEGTATVVAYDYGRSSKAPLPAAVVAAIRSLGSELGPEGREASETFAEGSGTEASDPMGTA